MTQTSIGLDMEGPPRSLSLRRYRRVDPARFCGRPQELSSFLVAPRACEGIQIVVKNLICLFLLDFKSAIDQTACHNFGRRPCTLRFLIYPRRCRSVEVTNCQ